MTSHGKLRSSLLLFLGYRGLVALLRQRYFDMPLPFFKSAALQGSAITSLRDPLGPPTPRICSNAMLPVFMQNSCALSASSQLLSGHQLQGAGQLAKSDTHSQDAHGEAGLVSRISEKCGAIMQNESSACSSTRRASCLPCTVRCARLSTSLPMFVCASISAESDWGVGDGQTPRFLNFAPECHYLSKTQGRSHHQNLAGTGRF